MSVPSHSFTLANNKFFYCGAANGDKSLHNTGTTHRWSDGNDKVGTTLCVQLNEKSQEETKWNGWTFVPTNIQGQRTSANILEACNAARLETPCDNPSYSDGKCVTTFANHLSVTPQHADFTLTDNKYFYAGVQSNGFSLGSTVASHRWATADNQNGQTLCVTGNEKAQNPQNWNGWWWIPTEVKGYPNSANILAACTALGYQTPCDHPSYNDGKCTVGFSGGHMSYIGHNNFVLANNKFFYCGGDVNTSNVTRHTSHVSRHTSHVTRHRCQRRRVSAQHWYVFVTLLSNTANACSLTVWCRYIAQMECEHRQGRSNPLLVQE